MRLVASTPTPPGPAATRESSSTGLAARRSPFPSKARSPCPTTTARPCSSSRSTPPSSPRPKSPMRYGRICKIGLPAMQPGNSWRVSQGFNASITMKFGTCAFLSWPMWRAVSLSSCGSMTCCRFLEREREYWLQQGKLSDHSLRRREWFAFADVKPVEEEGQGDQHEAGVAQGYRLHEAGDVWNEQDAGSSCVEICVDVGSQE